MTPARLQTIKPSVIADKFDANANKIWGIKPDETEKIPNTTFKDSVLTINKYKSDDGKFYTELCSVSGQVHEVFAADCWSAWDFMSQFSRNADGTISIKGDINLEQILVLAIPAVVVVVLATGAVVIIKKRKKISE